MMGNKNGEATKKRDPVSIGLTIGLSLVLAELAGKLTILPVAIERGIGMSLGMLICYWAPWNLHSRGKLVSWIVTSFVTGLIAFCVSLLFGRS